MAKSTKDQLAEMQAKYEERIAKERAKAKESKKGTALVIARAETAETTLAKTRKRARKLKMALTTCGKAKKGDPGSQFKEAMKHLAGLQTYIGKSAKAISACAVKMGDHSHAVTAKGKGHIKNGRYVSVAASSKRSKRASGKLTKKEEAIAKDILKKMGKKAGKKRGRKAA